MSAPRTRTFTPAIVREFAFPAETREQWHQVERAVLAAVMLDLSGVALTVARAAIRGADAFDDPRHGSVWESMLSLAAAGVPVDVATLAGDLSRRQCLNAIGGPQFLGELTDWLPTAAHVEAHARLVAEAHATREAVRAALGMVDDGARGDLAGVRQYLALGVEAASLSGASKSLAHISDLIVAQFEHIENAATGKSMAAPGLPWHLPTLNEWTDGMHGGELIVVAARPAVGKSAWIEQLVVHAAKACPDAGAVLYFSLEMNHREWAERALACEAGVHLDVVRGRKPPKQEEMDRLLAAANALHSLNIFVDDAARQTPTSIRARAEQMKRSTHGLALIVVDYLQLTESDEPTRGRGADNRVEEVAQITRAHKVMAKDLDVPCVLAAQLNRESEKGGKSSRPRLAQLRESGAVEQDANLVILLHVEGENFGPAAEQNYKDVLSIVEKSRGSRTGDVQTFFTGPFQRFTERAKQEGADEGAHADTRSGERKDDFDDDDVPYGYLD